MPKTVDYASRYQFLREAAFALVLREGVDALTRRALAAELGIGVNTIRRLVDPSAVLARFAADEVANRRRTGRFSRLPADPPAAAVSLVRRLLPDDESRIAEETVWLRLVTGCAMGGALVGDSEPGRLVADVQIAERGYADADLHGELAAGDQIGERTEPPFREIRRTEIERYVATRDEEMEATIRQALEVLGVADDAAALELRGLVDGLSLAVCSGRIGPDAAVAAVTTYLTSRHLTARHPTARHERPVSVDG